MARVIPEGATLVQEGLYVYESIFTMNGTLYTKWKLYSAEGYCFYDLQIPENYDEDGNLLPADQRVYYQYMIMLKNEEYVANNIISVPIEEGYEIVNKPVDTETI